jgi:hypothetical protein
MIGFNSHKINDNIENIYKCPKTDCGELFIAKFNYIENENNPIFNNKFYSKLT